MSESENNQQAIELVADAMREALKLPISRELCRHVVIVHDDYASGWELPPLPGAEVVPLRVLKGGA
jgi:hypothetical protein